MFFGGPAVICSLLSPKGKRIGDIFAGTVVISERGPKLRAAAGDATGAGVVGVVAAAVRTWRRASRAGAPIPLARNAIRSRIRDQMAYRIAGDVVARISPPPPPGTPPQYVLAAVLAERHRRELARLRPAPAEPPPGVGCSTAWAPHAQAWSPPPQAAPPPDAGGFAPPG